MREVLINVAVAVAAFILGRWSAFNDMDDDEISGWEGTDNE